MSATTILIVEDDVSAATLLEQRLTRLNYQVVGNAVSGEQAIELARRLRPNLVLMDISLGGSLDGVEAANAIRREYEVPVIYLTGDNNPDTLARAKATGAFGYILKPCEHRELAMQIEVAIYRHQVERDLYQQQEQLRVTLESIGDGFFACDADWRFVYVNQVAERLLDIRRDEVLGKSHWDVFPLTLGTNLEQEYRLAAAGQAREFENYYELWGRWFQNRCFPRAGGGMSVYFRDITGRKRAEQALRDTEASLRFALEASATGAWELDLADHTVRRTEQHDRIWGYPSLLPSWTYEMLLEHVLPEDRVVVDRQIQDAIRSGGVCNFECRIRRPEGDIRWIRVAGRHTLDGHSHARRMSGIIQDVTERRNTEEATLQAIPDLLFEADRDGRILRYSAPSDEHLYVSPVEFLGRTFQDMLPREAADVIREALAKADQAGVHRGATYALPFPEGLRWYELSIAARRGTAPGERRFIVLVRDITARRRAQAALAEAKEAADRANQAKSQFLAHVSHELRTPMAAVLGMLELSLRERLRAGLREHLQLAKHAAELQLELLDELLAFSRIEAGKIALEMAEFNLRTTLEQTLRVLAVKAREKGLELHFHLPRRAPVHLVGDAFRLRQILQNLLGNAIKFTDRGEVTVRVAVDTQTPQDVRLRFAVSDTGTGISREDQARIFAPFTQGDASLTRRHGGAGLGLSIASSLVALMDGQMSVDSAPGRGSTFTFTACFQRQSEELESPLEQAFLPPLRGLSVLVADPHPAGRQLVCEILADWSLQPTAAASTREALDAAQQRGASGRPFQALILDADLLAAEQDAWREFLRRSGRYRPAVVVVAPSGGVDAAKRFRRLRKDLTAVEKPLSQAEFLLALLRGLKIVPHASPGEIPEQRLTPAPRSLRILVADDAPIGRLFVSETLQERGHAVCTAASGREAFELVRDQSFDVVLMDVQMPEMDGYQATAAIRALPDPARAQLPIVALTAHARPEDERECLAAGMNAYLTKPLTTAALTELVERLAR